MKTNIYPDSIVKVTLKEFEEIIKPNKWVVDHIKTPVSKKAPTLYVCFPIKADGSKGTTPFQFLKEQLQLI